MNWRYAQTGRLFLQFFLAQQALTLILQIPLGLMRFLSELLLVMPFLDVVSDFAVVCLVATLFNALTGGILTLACAVAGLWSARWRKRLTLVFMGGLITFYVGDVLFGIVNGIIDNHFAIAVHELVILPAGLASLSFAVMVLRSENWPQVEKRLRDSGIALCALLLPLLLVPVARGVEFIDPYQHRSAAIARPVAKGPNILFIVIDTLSAPAMSLYGAPLPTTPKLENFARQGTVFDNYIATSNFTTPTVASMLSGQQPAEHGVFADSAYFMEDAGYRKKDLLPYVLRKSGYATGAAVSNVLAHPLKLHIEDGFDAVLTPQTACDPFIYVGLYFTESSLYKTIILVPFIRHLITLGSRLGCRNSRLSNFPPELTYSKALTWLVEGRDKSRPFFLWVHTLPPHGPYLPPAPYIHMFQPGNAFTRFGEYYSMGPEFASAGSHLSRNTTDILQNRYAENIRYADAVLDNFLAEVRRRGLLKNTIVIVTADHGETFRRWTAHSGPFLDQDLVHVPLVIVGPGIAQRQRTETTVSQVDLAPTILELAHLPAPAAMRGRSLVKLVKGKEIGPRPVFSMQSWPGSRFRKLVSGTFSVIDGHWKYVQYLDARKEELFDLAADKSDLHDLSSQQPQELERLRNMVDTYFQARKAPYPA